MLPSTTIQIAMELWGVIICLIFLIFISLGEDRTSRRSLLLAALVAETMFLLLGDSFAWFFRGGTGLLAFHMVRVSNFLVFALSFLIGYTAMRYLRELMRLRGRTCARWIRYSVSGVCLLGLGLVVVSQFTGFLYTIDEANLYARAGGYWSICVLAIAMLILLVCCSLSSYRSIPRTQSLPLLSLNLLALAASAAQFLFYGISLVNIAMAVGMVVMFIAYEKDRMLVAAERETLLMENSMELLRQKAELAEKDSQIATIKAQQTEDRTQLILSQIQPHFLYNALSAISFLCIRSPMKAKETLDCFSDYLRTNLDSLRGDRLVPFTEELAHTRAYLDIEQLRFGEDLRLAYDIRFTDFTLPSLSLQPIVENAVRHGICKREEGGTVLIRAEQTEDGSRITVTDDGVGFDPAAVPQDGRSHVGLENVRQRLRVLVGGELTVESAPGSGTTAVLFIPRQEG